MGEGEMGMRCVVAAGSGREGLAEPAVRDAILSLSQQATPSVLYLGTATYDLTGPEVGQTVRFAELGCSVTALKLVTDAPAYAEMQACFEQADVIIASGGNTLFAVDRWVKLGVDRLMQRALQRGAVLSGGSAGAICWFDGGHSDSMDPETYKNAMLAPATTVRHVSQETTLSDTVRTGWQYIRVPGLGMLPGLCCPHHDRIQSNGLLRAADFDDMLLRHAGETGIGIDHYAALVIDGENFRVISIDGQAGSVEGKPGVWKKTVVNGCIQAEVVPESGKVGDLLKTAASIAEDPRLAEVRVANPDDEL